MVAVYILIKMAARDPLEVLDQLRGIPAVKAAHVLLGPTDAIAFVECADHDRLRETLLAIRAVKGITETDTRYVYA